MKFNWRFSILVLAGLVPAFSSRAADDELAPLIKTILDVGPEGQGHRQAALAWRKLTAANGSALSAVLIAMDDANPLAANWLRSAAETIVDRQLDCGHALPADALEKFVLDVRHNPRVRRFAFELLVKADPTSPERLIPGMLDDPGAEFRRDAVQRLLDEAARLKSLETPHEIRSQLRRIYLKALGGAREQDQTEVVVQALEKLGHPVNLPEHFGLIIDWNLIGPFDNSGNRGFETAYPPESEIALDASYPGKTGDVTWAPFLAKDKYGLVDLVKAVGPGSGTASYAATAFSSDAERAVELRLTTSNAWKLWVNGQLVSKCEEYHRHMEPDRDETKTFMKPQFDQYRLKTVLKQGNNMILLKVCQNEQSLDWAQLWQFQLRVCDAAGKTILSQSRPHEEHNPSAPNGCP
jgi:hypothetical protein